MEKCYFQISQSDSFASPETEIWKSGMVKKSITKHKSHENVKSGKLKKNIKKHRNHENLIIEENLKKQKNSKTWKVEN